MGFVAGLRPPAVPAWNTLQTGPGSRCQAPSRSLMVLVLHPSGNGAAGLGERREQPVNRDRFFVE